MAKIEELQKSMRDFKALLERDASHFSATQSEAKGQILLRVAEIDKQLVNGFGDGLQAPENVNKIALEKYEAHVTGAVIAGGQMAGLPSGTAFEQGTFDTLLDQNKNSTDIKNARLAASKKVLVRLAAAMRGGWTVDKYYLAMNSAGFKDEIVKKSALSTRLGSWAKPPFETLKRAPNTRSGWYFNLEKLSDTIQFWGAGVAREDWKKFLDTIPDDVKSALDISDELLNLLPERQSD